MDKQHLDGGRIDMSKGKIGIEQPEQVEGMTEEKMRSIEGELAKGAVKKLFEQGLYKGCLYHSVYLLDTIVSTIFTDNEHLRKMGIEVFSDKELKQINKVLDMLGSKLPILCDGSLGNRVDTKTVTKDDDYYTIVDDDEDDDDNKRIKGILIGIRRD